jgi:hypothetical protein
MELLPGLNSPEWAHMFGDSTFQFEFDEEDDERDIIDLNGDLTEVLDRSHHAVACAMDQYRQDIPLTIPPTATEPTDSTSGRAPILVETVNADMERPTPRPLIPNKGVSVTTSKGDFGSANKGA